MIVIMVSITYYKEAIIVIRISIQYHVVYLTISWSVLDGGNILFDCKETIATMYMLALTTYYI